MPYGTSSGFSHRKRSRSAESAEQDDEATTAPSAPPKSSRLTSNERYGLFARLAWLNCYEVIFAAERAADAELMAELSSRFASTYTVRAMAQDPCFRREGHRALLGAEEMMLCSGCVGPCVPLWAKCPLYRLFHQHKGICLASHC